MRVVGMLVFVGGLILATSAVTTSKTSNPKQTTQSATQTKTNAAIHSERGTISSVTVNELILDHTWKGKQEKTKFAIDSATKKEGNVKQGDHVVVYYQLEKGQRIATELKASTNKPETKKS